MLKASLVLGCTVGLAVGLVFAHRVISTDEPNIPARDERAKSDVTYVTQALIARRAPQDGPCIPPAQWPRPVSLLDAWKNPMRVSCRHPGKYEIRSAGPDQTFDTTDDLTTDTPLELLR